jgi:hypothetical protein
MRGASQHRRLIARDGAANKALVSRRKAFLADCGTRPVVAFARAKVRSSHPSSSTSTGHTGATLAEFAREQWLTAKSSNTSSK